MRIAVIVGAKGRGSNMRAIVEACQGGRFPTPVEAVVIGPSEDAPALRTAASFGVTTVVPDDMEGELLGVLQAHNIDLVCLAGYMRLIPKDVVAAFDGRMLNIHPALLPKHGGKGMWGMRVHQAVLDAGDKTSGCTVHYVSERYDEGDVLLQIACDVLPDDTPETLAARVLELEHEAYVLAIHLWIERVYIRKAST